MSTVESVRAGNCLKKCNSLLQYGIFCKGVVDRVFATETASISAGFATQFIVQKVVNVSFDNSINAF